MRARVVCTLCVTIETLGPHHRIGQRGLARVRLANEGHKSGRVLSMEGSLYRLQEGWITLSLQFSQCAPMLAQRVAENNSALTIKLSG